MKKLATAFAIVAMLASTAFGCDINGCKCHPDPTTTVRTHNGH